MTLKRLLLLICLSVPFTGLYAQKLNFFQGTFEEAKAAAKKQRKLIYVMVDWGTGTEPNSPIPADQELLKKYNSGFICIFKNSQPKEGLNGIYQQYNINTYPTHLYLDRDGNLILRSSGSRSAKQPYLEEIEKAQQLSKGQSLTQFAQEFQKGNRNEQFLKRYLLKYEDLNIPVDQQVLAAYADLLPVNKLDDFETISFLIQRGPALTTTAYKISRLNPKLVDSVYKSLPYERRVVINNRTINASMALARQKKDESIAMQTAAFTQSTWNKDWQRGHAAYSSKLMEYYKSVNDSTKYLIHTLNYYQQYYSSLRDSIHIPENPMRPGGQASRRPQLLNFPAAEPSGPIKRDPKKDSATIARQKVLVTTVVRPSTGISSIAPVSDFSKAMEYAMNLNNGAWSMYSMKTLNPHYLSQAVIWSRRSVELFPENPAFHDTLAHLFYQQKNYTEAIAYQQKAVILAKAEAERLAKMKASSVNNSMINTAPAFKNIDMYTQELEKMKLKTL